MRLDARAADLRAIAQALRCSRPNSGAAPYVVVVRRTELVTSLQDDHSPRNTRCSIQMNNDELIRRLSADSRTAMTKSSRWKTKIATCCRQANGSPVMRMGRAFRAASIFASSFDCRPSS